ncbi:putative disease resistance protein RGA3 [Zingiber officinale]|uniref:putative disease resistance protein RGA3 n=1 Tax=Zingiber officinale TaxID=94328 RepID=UPI001C4D08BF|nr:putative disease resistance protein RGA3 [Zingiber officinale]
MEFVSMFLLDALVNTLADTLQDHVFQELQKVHRVGDELVKLEKSVSSIQAILSDAQEIEETRNIVKQLLNELREVAYRANDILDDVATEQQRQQLIKFAAVRNSLGAVNPMRFFFKQDVYHKIQSIDEELDKIVKRCPLIALSPRNRSQRTHSSESTPAIPPCVLGRERDKQKIKELLMPFSGRTDSAASVISIFGMPGVGKTTLAQELFDDETVKKHFELRLWVYVSHDFDLMRIMRFMIESIDGFKCDLTSLNNLQQEVRKKVSRRRYLLVLDNVWQESQEWEKLKSFLYSADEGSKILVTTKSEQVARFMAANSPPYHLEGLSMDDCWSLICQQVLSGNPSATLTHDFSQSHALRRCMGLPMAAKALGQRLAREADRSKWEAILTGQSWEFSGADRSITETLSLSYQHLPHYLKPCFEYLSVIPKGFKLERDFIIQLWMAQSFIRPKGTEHMEDVGSDYLDSLRSSSFLQYSHFDHKSRRQRYVMHDVFHEFARHVAAEGCSVMEPSTELHLSLSAGVRHLSVNYEELVRRVPRGGDMYEQVYKCKGLQSLLLIGNSTSRPTMVVPDDLAQRLRSLRTLMLTNSCLTQLPESIGDLSHLRCLQLQNTGIKRLPDSVSRLYNLQTLGLRNCYDLEELPKDMSKLRNLRHLDLHLNGNSQGSNAGGKLRLMPPEIGLLTHLRTLSRFVVSKRHECGLSQLENLNDLRSELLIERLDLVSSGEDAKNANLSSKEHIHRLELTWNYSDVTEASASSAGYNSRENILKYLRPHNKLKEIGVVGYGGTLLPTWMGDSSLENLETVWISKTYSCQNLPPLGQLPKLKYLFLEEMHGLKHIECSFCGRNEIRFPKLEKLHLENMSGLQEWLGDHRCALPSLRELTIKNCPALQQLTHELPSLTKLVIEASPYFAGLPDFPKLQSLEVKTNDDWIWRSCATISSLPSLTLSGLRRANLPSEIGSCHSFIRRLEISYCSQLIFIPDGWLPAFLSHFVIRHCPKLQNLPAELTRLTRLEDLEIEKCEKLEQLPFGLRNMNLLAHLEISDCPGLSWLHGLPRKLQFLSISNCPELSQKLQDQGWFTRRKDLQVWINGKHVLT